MGRYKSIIGKRLRSRKLANQQTEVALGCSTLNRILNCAQSKSVRITDKPYRATIKDPTPPTNASMHQRRALPLLLYMVVAY